MGGSNSMDWNTYGDGESTDSTPETQPVAEVPATPIPTVPAVPSTVLTEDMPKPQ